MSAQNYKRTVEIKSTATAVFQAVTVGVGRWWTKPDRPMQKLGDQANFAFPPSSAFWTFALTELKEPSRVEWTCTEAHHVHEGLPKSIEKEWLHTKILWTMKEVNGGVMVTLEHDGLNRELVCYDICETGWDMFFLGSLKQFLETGKGSPHKE